MKIFTKNRLYQTILCIVFILPSFAKAQTINHAFAATVNQSGGGTGVNGPVNYNDGMLGPGVGWVSDDGWIEYTWTNAVRLNSVVFYNSTRPLKSADIEYWDGTQYVSVYSYVNNTAPFKDSIGFRPISTTKLRFNNMLSNSSNPNFREIQTLYVTPVPNDASVLSIDSPAVSCSGMLDIYITVRNLGSNQIDSVEIHWDFDGVRQQTKKLVQFLDTLNGSNPSTALVYMGTTRFVSGSPSYIKAWTEMPNGVVDTNYYNDTAQAVKQASFSGNYTLDPSQAATSGNFQSFSAFADALNIFGICGPVKLTVSPGTYSDYFRLTKVHGTSPTNTITIDGQDSSTTILSHNGRTGWPARESFGTVVLDSTSYVTIKNMTIISSGNYEGASVLFANGSSHNLITNNVLIADSIATSFHLYNVLFAGSGDGLDPFGENPDYNTDADYNTIANNKIIGGRSGVFVDEFGTASAANLNVNNKILDNEMRKIHFYGIFSIYQDSLEIRGNSIDLSERGNIYSNGVLLFYSRNTILNDNYIHAGNYGIQYNNNSTFAKAFRKTTINNNMVISDNAIGIYLSSVDSVDLFHNSISAKANAISIGATSSKSISDYDVRNNIFSSGFGQALFTELPDTIFDNLDHNLYHSNASILLKVDSSSYKTLSDYQTASPLLNMQSIQGDPQFESGEDLHIVGILANDAGDNSVGINYDIDGEVRPMPGSTTVDIGADEYNPPSCPPLYNLTANTPHPDSITLQWEGGTSGMYEYEIVLSGNLQGSGNPVITASDSVRVGGLLASTAYDYYVRQICGSADTSLWWGPFKFYTASTLVYFEDFESFNGLDLSNGWTSSTFANPYWRSAYSALREGPIADHTIGQGGIFTYLSNDNTAGASDLISPPIYIDTNTHVEFSFWYHMFGSTMGDMNVYVDTNGVSNLITTLSGQQQAAQTDPWLQFSTYLIGYEGKSIRLRFEGVKGVGYYSAMAIDDVKIDTIPRFSAGVVEMVSPESLICPGTFAPVVGVRNLGINDIDSVEVYWEVNGNVMGPVMYNSTISSGDTVEVTLGNITFNNSTYYDLKFYTHNPNSTVDPSPMDDTLRLEDIRTGLAGTYTINPNQAKSISNFTSFIDAANDLEKFGLCGPTVFTASPGMYPGPLSFSEIEGSNSTNTVTFDGLDSSNTIITHDGTVVRPVIILDGVDYINFRNLGIVNTGTSSSVGIHLINNANNNSVSNSSIKVSTSSTSSTNYALVSSGNIASSTIAGTNASNLTIENNRIVGGYYGIRLNGLNTDLDYGNTIRNNILDSVYYYGVYTSDLDSVVIEGNKINMHARGNSNADGIWINECMNFSVLANNVNVPDYGIHATDANSDFTPRQRAQFINNMVISSGDYGMYLNDALNVDIFHNSISVAGSTQDAFYLTGSATDSVDIRNNIFASASSSAFNYDAPIATLIDLDNNTYYTGGNDLAKLNGTSYTNLSAFQTAAPSFNINSISGDPEFVSSTSDLHISGSFVNNKGDNSVMVDHDIDGDLRPGLPSTIVDIGADEFNLSGDIAVLALLSPVSKTDSCFTSSENIELLITNTGNYAIDFTIDTVDLHIEVTGAVAKDYSLQIDDNSYNNGVALSTGDSITVTIGSIDMTTIGSYNFKAYATLELDTVQSNDTITSVIQNVTSGGSLVSSIDSICGNGFVTLSTQGSSGELQWQRLVGGNFMDEVSADSTAYEVFIDSTTTFRLVACGVEISDSITIVSLLIPSAPTASGDSVEAFCGVSGNAILTASASSSTSTLNWYDADNNLIGTGDTLFHPYSSSNQSPDTTYSDTLYVAESILGCEGPKSLAIATINIDIPSAPTASGDSVEVFCGVSGNAILTASASSSTSTLNWYDANNNLIGTGDTLFHPYSSSSQSPDTTYSDTLYVAESILGCEGPRSLAIATINIDIPLAPLTTGDTAIVFCGDSGTAVLTAASALAGADFNWYTDSLRSVMLATGNSYQFGLNTSQQSATTIYSDTFYVSTVDSASKCESELAMVSGTVICTVGQDEISNRTNELVIFPNPTRGVFNLIGNNVEDEIEVSIFNSNGQLIYQLDSKVSNSFNKQIDLTEFSKGIYFVKFQGNAIMQTKKLIIK